MQRSFEKPKVYVTLRTIVLYCVLPLYFAISLLLFFTWVNPSLMGETNSHIAADSRGYLEDATALREGTAGPFVIASMYTFPNTHWAPVFLGMLLRNSFAIVLANYVFLFCSVRLLGKAVDMDTGVFLLLLLANATTWISLLSLNKEIIDLLITSLFVYYLAKGNKLVLTAALIAGLISRWEVAVLMLCFLGLRSRWNPLRRHRGWSLVGICLLYSILISSVLSGSMADRLAEAVVSSEGTSGILLILDNLQLHFLFFVAVIPKILDNLFAELLNVPHWQAYSLADPANGFILFGNNLANFVVLALLALTGRLTLRSEWIYYAALTAIIMSTALVIQPRYFYSFYVLLCLEVARHTSAREPVFFLRRVHVTA